MKLPHLFLAVGLIGLGLLAACAGSPAVVQVTLANTQAEVAAINIALKSEAAVLITTLPAADQVKANQALAAEEAAAAAFDSIPVGDTFTVEADAVIGAVGGLVSIVPMPPATQLAVQGGLVLVTALVNNLSTIPAASTVSPTLTAPAHVIAAPIAIPVFAPVLK